MKKGKPKGRLLCAAAFNRGAKIPSACSGLLRDLQSAVFARLHGKKLLYRFIMQASGLFQSTFMNASMDLKLLDSK
ncbi:MAG TPA: hypothetical protein VHY08_23325, partial [Bacillota bacterium]|nr:hypothetical protein [Bacillota bacterium]